MMASVLDNVTKFEKKNCYMLFIVLIPKTNFIKFLDMLCH